MTKQEFLPIIFGSFAFWVGLLLFSSTLSPFHKLTVIETALIGLSLSLFADGKLNPHIITNLKKFEKDIGISLIIFSIFIVIINILNFFKSFIFFFVLPQILLYGFTLLIISIANKDIPKGFRIIIIIISIFNILSTYFLFNVDFFGDLYIIYILCLVILFSGILNITYGIFLQFFKNS